ELNIAANRLGTFRDIPNLARLRCLRSLTTADPHYGANPVCALYNFTTYCLFHLPQLGALDRTPVLDSARALAEATYGKKRMYYSMRIKAAQRLLANATDCALAARRQRGAQLELGLNVLLRQRADCAQELGERAGTAPPPPPTVGEAGASAAHAAAVHALALGGAGGAGRELGAKVLALDAAVEGKAKEGARLDAHLQLLSVRGASARDHTIGRLLLELESGGNVRLEEGAASDVWFSSCADLLHSRFYAADFAALGVEGVVALRVTRVHNRALRTRFDERLDALAEAAAAADGGGGGAGRRSLEYLFASPLAGGSGAGGGEGGAVRGGAEVEGGDEARRREDQAVLACAELGLGARGWAGGSGEGGEEEEAAAMVSNSLSLVDLPRLTRSGGGGGGLLAEGAMSEWGVFGGQLLVCKAFLGVCAQEDPLLTRRSGGRVLRADYPSAHSVCRTRGDDPRQREYLALVEYVLSFEYLPSATSPLATAAAQFSKKAHAAELAPLSPADVGGLSSSELGPLARPLATFLQRCVPPCALAGPGAVSALPPGEASYDPDVAAALALPPQRLPRGRGEHADVHGLSLRRLDSIGGGAGARLCSLSLSYNALESLLPLSACTHLTHLDVSFNLLRSLEGLGQCRQLASLDASANLLSGLGETCNALKSAHAGSLRRLLLRGNALAEEKGRLPLLAVLDLFAVGAEERRSADKEDNEEDDR
ncbi:hypothetical protein T492DRAFT_863766, partial [Pavlovales sp. CCMP2436]